MTFKSLDQKQKKIWKRITWLFTAIPTSWYGIPHWIVSLDHRTHNRISRAFIFNLIWISNHLSPRRLWKLRYVNKELQIQHIPVENKFQGGIWGISIVRDEEDIIEIAIRNLFNQGINAIIVIDHGSKDSTFEIIKILQKEYPNLYTGTYSGKGYFQSFIVTKLAARARRAGARWVIPFDADEIWVSENESIFKTLEQSDLGVVVADLYNCFPIHNVKSLKEFQIDSIPSSTKCALRLHRGLLIPQGNHTDISKWSKKQKLLTVMHFPWRSKSQLVSKVRQGAQAERNANITGSDHWHWADKQSDQIIDDLWTRLIEGNPVPEIAWSRTKVESELLKISWHEQFGPKPPTTYKLNLR